MFRNTFALAICIENLSTLHHAILFWTTFAVLLGVLSVRRHGLVAKSSCAQVPNSAVYAEELLTAVKGCVVRESARPGDWWRKRFAWRKAVTAVLLEFIGPGVVT